MAPETNPKVEETTGVTPKGNLAEGTAAAKRSKPSAGAPRMKKGPDLSIYERISTVAALKVDALWLRFDKAAQGLKRTLARAAESVADVTDVLSAILVNQTKAGGERITTETVAKRLHAVGVIETRNAEGDTARGNAVRYMAGARWSHPELMSPDERVAIVNEGVEIDGETYHQFSQALRDSGKSFTYCYAAFADAVREAKIKSGSVQPPAEPPSTIPAAVKRQAENLRVRITTTDKKTGAKSTESVKVKENAQATVTMCVALLKPWSGKLSEHMREQIIAAMGTAKSGDEDEADDEVEEK